MMNLPDHITGIKETNSVDFVKQVFNCFSQRTPVAFVKSDAERSAGLTFAEILTPEAGGGWLDVSQATIDENTPAQIVFTSGTEGLPKAILLNHDTLKNTVDRLISVMSIDDTIREYVGVPVYYSFGFGRCRTICAAGGKAYIPEKGFNPLEIKNMLEKDEINAISAVPTLWRLLLSKKELFVSLGEKVKWIEIGSQYMSGQEKQAMLDLFPNATIVQHYGLTEASRATFLVLNQTPTQHLDAVGQCSDLVEVKIADDHRIMLRGKNVADGIIKDNQLYPVADENGWLTTNDLGHIKDGYLYYDGRNDDIINCGGIKINPDGIQLQLEQKLKLTNEVVISKYPCPVRGEGFLISVLGNCAISDEVLSSELTQLLDPLSVNAASSIRVLRLPQFPKTATGKVQRKQLTAMYHPDEEKKVTATSPKFEHYLYNEFASTFPTQSIRDDSTFSGLGGDSLNFVQISMALEDHLGFLPDNWEKTPLSQLAKLKAVKKSFWTEIDSSIVLRVIAIIAVVLTHADFNYAGGGTLLLFVLVGYNMGRFKHSEFVRQGAWSWYANYAAKIFIPYIMLAAIFVLVKKEFDWTALLLITNLIELKLTFIFPFWFVQVLLQSLLIVALMLSIKSVRNYLRSNPWQTAIALLAFFLVVRILYPLVWDTDYLRNLVPQRFILLLWLGYCFNFANTAPRKYFLLAAGMSIAYFDVGIDFRIHWVMWGSLVLAFFPKIKVPYFSRSVFNTVANATFYIFIFNGIVFSVLLKLHLPEYRLLTAFLMLLGCVVIWKFIDYFQFENKVVILLKRVTGQHVSRPAA